MECGVLDEWEVEGVVNVIPIWFCRIYVPAKDGGCLVVSYVGDLQVVEVVNAIWTAVHIGECEACQLELVLDRVVEDYNIFCRLISQITWRDNRYFICSTDIVLNVE